MPAFDLRFIVTSWVLSRFNDPYQGARRELDIPGLWFARIPQTEVGSTVVVCSYWIHDLDRVARCNTFGTLGLPV